MKEPISFVLTFITVVLAYFFYVEQRHFEIFIGAIAIFFLTFLFPKKLIAYAIRILSLYFICFYLVLQKWPFIGYIAWPFDLYVASILFFISLKLTKCEPEKLTLNWKLTRGMLFSLAAIVLASVICLTGYFYFNPEVAKQFPEINFPMWSMPLIILAMALVNGIREELLFRFILQNSLGRVISFRFAIIISSILFGFIHFKAGFPQGYLGVVLTSLFGLIIGLQYFFYKSVLLTALTHAVTDAIMFAIILFSKSI